MLLCPSFLDNTVSCDKVSSGQNKYYEKGSGIGPGCRTQRVPPVRSRKRAPEFKYASASADLDLTKIYSRWARVEVEVFGVCTSNTRLLLNRNLLSIP